MSTAAIYNGFGQYEQNNEGQKGITLPYAGLGFWLPYRKVTYIPDWTLREVDHDLTAASNGAEEGFLTYKAHIVPGNRIAEELLETQIPFKNSDKGIILITPDQTKRKPSYIHVPAGFSEAGQRLTSEVQEIEPSPFDIAEADRRAQAYKQEVVQSYFQAKRERMAGGQGPIVPTGLIKVFMAELGVQDIDDVSRQIQAAAATPGMTIADFAAVMERVLGVRDDNLAKRVLETAPGNPVPPSVPVVPLTKRNPAESIV